jgi:hypothetical protein
MILLQVDPKLAVLHALSIALYPIVFFFGYLYYTDAGGLLCVMLMYYLSRMRKVSTTQR